MKWHRTKRARLNVYNENGDCVAACGGTNDSTKDPDVLYAEQCANARLIAAAPEMYAKLEHLASVMRIIDRGKIAEDIDVILEQVRTEPFDEA